MTMHRQESSLDDLSPNPLEIARRRRIEAGLSIIDLTSTNPVRAGFQFPKEILEEGTKRYLADRHYTPDPYGLKAARESIAELYANRNPPLHIDPDDIVITASTSEAYVLLLTMLCEPGESILAPSINYPLFEHLAEMRRVTIEPYPLELTSSEWSTKFSSAPPHIKAVHVVSPHNPTGHIVSGPLPISCEIPIIVDEVFTSFAETDDGAPPLGAFMVDHPVFHLGGISKQFALPDLKLGWIAMNRHASNRFRAQLGFLNDLLLGASYLTQSLLPDIVRFGLEFSRTMARSLRLRLLGATNALEKIKSVRVPTTSGGIYLFPRFDLPLDDEQLALALLDRGVLTHPGYFFGDIKDSHLAVSCMVPEGELREGIERICTSIESLS